MIEAKFVGVGDALSQALEGIGALITALDDLTGALDENAIAATVGELNDAATKLSAVPEDHLARRTVVADLERRRVELGPCVSDMRQTLAYMRAFTMIIKITAGGIVQADGEFGVFAQEISSRIESGRAELDSLSYELEALKTPIAAVAQLGEAMAARCKDLIPLVPDALRSSAQLIGDHHSQIATAANAASDLARDIRKQVGRILAALQIGDITRQRIEHVQSGLAHIEGAFASLADDPRRRAGVLVQMLLAAQLGDAIQDYDREIGKIVASMEDLASNARALLKLRDLASGRGANATTGVLQTLKTRLTEAQALVDEIEATELEVLRTGQATGDAARILASRLAAIQTMKSDVQYMALNTTLKSCRIGDAGRPLATVAVELRAHAGYLDTIANKGIDTLNQLTGAAARLIEAGSGRDGSGQDEAGDAESGGDGGRTRQVSAAKTANAALGAAARRIGRASDQSDRDLLCLAERGEAVLALLNNSPDRLALQDDIGHALEGVAADLADLAKDAEPCDALIKEPVSALLSQLYAGYTMVQERTVHEAFLQTWNIESGFPVAAAPAAELEPLDDILF